VRFEDQSKKTGERTSRTPREFVSGSEADWNSSTDIFLPHEPACEDHPSGRRNRRPFCSRDARRRGSSLAENVKQLAKDSKINRGFLLT
jgi:hypothetical protein